jgi:hypothetical protein
MKTLGLNDHRMHMPAPALSRKSWRQAPIVFFSCRPAAAAAAAAVNDSRACRILRTAVESFETGCRDRCRHRRWKDNLLSGTSFAASEALRRRDDVLARARAAE